MLERRLAVATLAAAAACVLEPRSPPPVPTPEASTTSASHEASDGSSTGRTLDLPDDATCRAVDLLFIIDNSRSMADEQHNLLASFPGFIAGIENRLGHQASYHVGIVTTDHNAHNDAGCRHLGALTTRTGGLQSSNASCGPFAEGGRFMTVADDLTSAFACVAQVGVGGDDQERPVDALRHALLGMSPETTACNLGFVRDGALLVVVLITDEEDDGDSLGGPQLWHESLVAAKHGDEEAIVLLTLVGHPKPNACLAEQWTGSEGAELAPRLIALTEHFTHGLVGDICAPSYDAFFAAAVDGIATACTMVVD